MAITTPTSAKAWAPDLTYFPPAEVIPDALIVAHTTNAGPVEGDEPIVRVPLLDDGSSQVTEEGDEIPESEPTLGEATFSTQKVTHLLRISREQHGQPNAAAMLAQSASRSVTKKANEVFLNNAAGQAVTGVIHTDGLSEGSPLDADLDPLVDLLAEVQSNGATPTAILLDPLTWASLRKIKVRSGSNVSMLGAGVDDAAQKLLGVPVQVSNSMPANTGLVLDKSSIISAQGNVAVATSTDAYFSSDSIAVRATFRFGFVIPRPERVGIFSLTEAGV